MKLEHTTLDLATASKEDIKREVARMEQLSKELKNEEQGIKVLLNSIYGALGNKWLICFNPDIAETITLQGQDMIKHAQRVVNLYFNEHWHLDTDLHEKLGITGDVRKVYKSMIVAGDTDSAYVCYDEVVNSCNSTLPPKDFILAINKHRLSGYIKVAFDRYAERMGTKNYQDFELENISESGIFLMKKKYMLNKIWEEGIDFKPLEHIAFKGIELVQSSTSVFARDRLRTLIRFVFTKKNTLNLSEIIALLKEYKKEFKMTDPDKIAMGRSVNDYSKYIACDNKDRFEVGKATPIQVRAAGYYNHMLNVNAKFKNKYEMIKAGDKIKFYHAVTNNPLENVFGYLAGSFPVEFAPPIDYDTQFAKTIIDPINRITKSMGLPEIGNNLYYNTPLF